MRARALLVALVGGAVAGCPATLSETSWREGIATVPACADVRRFPPLAFGAIERMNLLDGLGSANNISASDVRTTRVVGIQFSPGSAASVISAITVYVEPDATDSSGPASARVEVARSRPRASPADPFEFELTGADVRNIAVGTLSVSTAVTVTGCSAVDATAKLGVAFDVTYDANPARRATSEPAFP